MGFEQFELLPQSPSKTLTPKPYNTKSLLFGIFIGIFLGIIGTLLVEKSFNSTPFHSPLSRKARNLPASQDEEKQAVDLLKICRANESDCEVFKQNLTICVANIKVLKEEKWVEKKKKKKIQFRLTADAEHKKAITLIGRLETEKGTIEAQLVETKKKVVHLDSENFNSAPFHSPMSRKARNLPASQDEEKQAVDLLKVCRANEWVKILNNEIKNQHFREKLALLIDSKNSDKKPSACPVPQTFEGKCRLGWAYLKETDSCYFYYEFTYNDEGQLNTYKWETAEEDCTRSGAHLASIHSKVELEFLKSKDLLWHPAEFKKLRKSHFDIRSKVNFEMISSSFRKNNVHATPTDGCSGTDFYVWFGLRHVDGKRTYSDGTPDDFVETGDSRTVTGNLYYSMCYESTNINHTYIFYHLTENHPRMSRYICQKAANK